MLCLSRDWARCRAALGAKQKYVAIGTGISGSDWSKPWLDARVRELGGGSGSIFAILFSEDWALVNDSNVEEERHSTLPAGCILETWLLFSFWFFTSLAVSSLCRWTLLLDTFQGWLAAPLTYLLPCVVGLFNRGTPILAGGICVARLWWFLFFCCCFFRFVGNFQVEAPPGGGGERIFRGVI